MIILVSFIRHSVRLNLSCLFVLSLDTVKTAPVRVASPENHQNVIKQGAETSSRTRPQFTTALHLPLIRKPKKVTSR